MTQKFTEIGIDVSTYRRNMDVELKSIWRGVTLCDTATFCVRLLSFIFLVTVWAQNGRLDEKRSHHNNLAKTLKEWIFRSSRLQVSYKIKYRRVLPLLGSFLKYLLKYLLKSLLDRYPGKGTVLWVLRNYSEQSYCRTPRDNWIIKGII